jgi:hypothetical protein
MDAVTLPRKPGPGRPADLLDRLVALEQSVRRLEELIQGQPSVLRDSRSRQPAKSTERVRRWRARRKMKAAAAPLLTIVSDSEAPAELTAEPGVGFFECTGCWWPLHEAIPNAWHARFCGQQTDGSSYCDQHRKLSVREDA